MELRSWVVDRCLAPTSILRCKLREAFRSSPECSSTKRHTNHNSGCSRTVRNFRPCCMLELESMEDSLRGAKTATSSPQGRIPRSPVVLVPSSREVRRLMRSKVNFFRTHETKNQRSSRVRWSSRSDLENSQHSPACASPMWFTRRSQSFE